jgi:hypothetical protein
MADVEVTAVAQVATARETIALATAHEAIAVATAPEATEVLAPVAEVLALLEN